MIEQSIAVRIKSAIENAGISYIELEKRTGIAKSSLQRYASGNTKKIPIEAVELIASATGCDAAWIMGWRDNIPTIPSGIIPLPKMVKKPRLGVIACGEPILTAENIETNDFVPEDIKCDFTLKCKGDSMVNARINDGDIVYIKHQEQVENGEIAACLVDGDFDTTATLKRYYKFDDRIILQSENPKYQPFVYVNEEMNKVRIIGKAVGFTSKI